MRAVGYIHEHDFSLSSPYYAVHALPAALLVFLEVGTLLVLLFAGAFLGVPLGTLLVLPVVSALPERQPRAAIEA